MRVNSDICEFPSLHATDVTPSRLLRLSYLLLDKVENSIANEICTLFKFSDDVSSKSLVSSEPGWVFYSKTLI